MNLLAFDTSSPVLSVALKKGDAALSESKLVGFIQHAENLLPMIDALLKEKKLSLSKIDAFLIGRGPGSFTGLRIGFATLKSFVVIDKKPCFGALSLDMIAANTPLSENAYLAVCLDAHREKIYTRFYRHQKNGWRALAAAKVLTLEELIRELPEGTHVSGDALIRYGDALKKGAAKKNLRLLPESFWHPKASTLIHWHTMKEGKGGVTPPLQRLQKAKDFLPLYFRLSEAEEKKKNYAAAC